ncbi:hypothetical protein BBBOND_0208820 [Babesia bigemina]|uniref:Major facilitator superfamily (MFS) profile domain-containing protein n=1 Tax=Babesia bigemina TaxID=5866 RepID=A0A061D589_BABBI|nr:hypothetical protein BBBOND_0208820 [Babesia bigemina]CDR95728.1 hypothetical protein BBBOND_0208820 [Babesia bigemina]|eukprot:XP_012767914.1 hypothetical protein BBBOND_0208820 [Babesia bigemina]
MSGGAAGKPGGADVASGSAPDMEAGKTVTAEKQTEDYGTFGQVLYHVVSFTEGYEQQVLYLCMRIFESTMNFTKSQLTTLMTVSILSRLCFSLVWGLLADAFETNLVMAAGLLFMGIASILLSATSRFSSQKIISDRDDDDDSNSSSSTFTRLHALNCIGRMLCAAITTEAAQNILLGFIGWRVSYIVLGYLWISVGIAIVFAMHTDRELISPYDSTEQFINQISGAFKAVFTNWSAFLCIFTMLIAEAPMCTLPYMITYLEYLGVSDMKVGIAILVTTIGGAAGTAAGGIVIEKITSMHKKYGELIAGIVVMGVRLIVCVLFFVSPAPDGRLMWYHYIEFAILGATLVTVGGVDRPIMRKVIPDRYQASASAIIQCISGISVSVSFVEIFAYVSEKLHGYAPSTQAIDDMEKGLKDNNTEALRKSTMYMIVVGSLLNIACYGALFATYETDKKTVDDQNVKVWEERDKMEKEKKTGKYKEEPVKKPLEEAVDGEDDFSGHTGHSPQTTREEPVEDTETLTMEMPNERDSNSSDEGMMTKEEAQKFISQERRSWEQT